MSEPAPTPEKMAQPCPPRRRQLLTLSIVGGAILLLAGISILLVLGLRGTGQPSEPTPAPTVRTEPTAPASVSPTTVPTCQTIISSGDVEVSIALPVSLAVRDATFSVEPIVPQAQAWTYPPDRSGIAVWVCGTVVNYIIGLEPTPENETLLTNLTPGDDIKLQLSSGAVLPFRYAGREEVAAGDENALAQQQPGLTLVLTASGAWQIARAAYVAEAEAMEPPSSEGSAQPGQPVQIGDARVTVNRGHEQRSDDLPPGTMYYLVEYSVENVGQAPLATEQFSMKLIDSMGNTYLLSPRASAAGESGLLTGEIAPGTSARGSAGFLVPDPLQTGTLLWVFSPGAGSVAQASVSIAYEGEAESVAQVDVTVNDAFFGSDGNRLILEGEVRNTGTKPLTIEAADISLSSSAGLGELIMPAPPLPWAIEPGEIQVIELQYQRPDASTVLLEILGYTFEIDGLQ
jgi:hypothetical protein